VENQEMPGVIHQPLNLNEDISKTVTVIKH
jgi:hypothetical protein